MTNDVYMHHPVSTKDELQAELARVTAERDALKNGIVAFVVRASPRMPMSLAGALADLMALVKS